MDENENSFALVSPELRACIMDTLGEEAYDDIGNNRRPPSSAEQNSIENCMQRFGSSQKTEQRGSQQEGYKRLYEPYPDTDEAPILEFFWGPDKNGQPSDITRVTPYGCWEDWKDTAKGLAYEPAVEMQFYTKTYNDPFYAVAPGRVIYVYIGENDAGFINIAYGTNYSVTYHHIQNIIDTIVQGKKVEAGELLGFTEKKLHPDSYWEGWWEIALNARRGSVARTVPPIDYFSEKSKAKLQAILDASPFWSVIGSPKTWAVTTGCSWVKYLSKPEWWTDLGTVGAGYVTAESLENSERLEDFLKNVNSSWEVGDPQGRIVGPKDQCR